ncbi:MAG: aminoacyl-tRNA hydrolase [Parcubacteria group bacterium]|nr:aminoacyl-tRNA hydrolase [Parcubacteria group bacterium]
MKIIVGLGNTGEKYLKTRHNTGQFYLFKLRDAWSDKDFSEGKNALWLEAKVDKNKVYLIFPAEMMNNSGASLKKTLTALKLKAKPSDILIIHDDLDIELGRSKLAFARSSAGHNGVESIIKNLKTNKFWRLRVGIGIKKKPDGKKLIDFILKKLTPAEERILNKNFKKIAEGLEIWLTHPDKAMSIINSSK